MRKGGIIILITFIIPVYNKEHYLNNCIKSVLEQDYRNIEVIIIDDGSTDKSRKIIKKWKAKDDRIRYYEQENHGVAFTRNKGMGLARGDYIFFQDADDSLNNQAIKKMVVNAKETMADMVVGNYYIKSGNKISKNKKIEKRILTPKELALSQVRADMFLIGGRPLSSVCNKLYKKEFLIMSKARFVDNVLAEDRLFNLICFINGPKISLLDEYTYTINIMENSRSRSFNENYYKESIQLVYSFKKWLEEKNKIAENKDLLEYSLITDVDKSLNYAYKYSTKKVKELNHTLNLLRNDALVSRIMKNTSSPRAMKNITGKKSFFFRVQFFHFLILYAPRIVFVFIFISYQSSIGLRKKIKLKLKKK